MPNKWPTSPDLGPDGARAKRTDDPAASKWPEHKKHPSGEDHLVDLWVALDSMFKREDENRMARQRGRAARGPTAGRKPARAEAPQLSLTAISRRAEPGGPWSA